MSRDHLVQHLADTALQSYPAEAAPHLEVVSSPEIADLLQRRDPKLAADVLRRLGSDTATGVIEALEEPAASRILSVLEPALAAALIARLDEDARRNRLAKLTPALAKELTELMSYPPGVAGSIMDPRVTSFRPETPVHEVLARIRALRNVTIHDVYLVDDEGRLTGSAGIQAVALAEPTVRLGDLAQREPPRVQALAPHAEVIATAEDRRLVSLPVVDISQRLLGVIRYADLLSTTQHAATADIQTMVGVSKEERALSGARFAVRKRLLWLQINLATAFLASAVVGLFEGTIARFTALAVLLPVVAGQSGNTGAQALAVTMRGLALREIRVRHWFRVGRKELVVGFVNGIAVALVTSLAVLLWSRSLGIAAVIGSAMVCSMVIAGVAGASVPMALIVLRQDPAAASSIVLTTITDVMGFLTFLGFATLVSGLL